MTFGAVAGSEARLEAAAFVIALRALVILPAALFVGWAPKLTDAAVVVVGLLGVAATLKCLGLAGRFQAYSHLQWLVVLLGAGLLQEWLTPAWLADLMSENRP